MKTLIKLITNFGLAVAAFFGLALVFVAYFLVTTPRPTDLRDCLTTKLFEVRLCPKDSSYVKLKNISPHIKNAVIVSEDSTFYSHKGFDWFEMKQSLQTNLEKKTYARGGSTITQQLAKNVYLTSEKSLLRKAREAFIVVQIEDTLTKNEILEKYLNVVEFGPKLYGIGPASRHYFGKSPANVTVAEAAFLAFLLPSPAKHSVSFKKKQLTRFARSQVRKIIERMYRFKNLSEADYQAALAQADYLFGGVAPGSSDEPTAEELSFDDFEGGEAPASAPAPAPDSDPTEQDEESLDRMDAADQGDPAAQAPSDDLQGDLEASPGNE